MILNYIMTWCSTLVSNVSVPFGIEHRAVHWVYPHHEAYHVEDLTKNRCAIGESYASRCFYRQPMLFCYMGKVTCDCGSTVFKRWLLHWGWNHGFVWIDICSAWPFLWPKICGHSSVDCFTMETRRGREHGKHHQSQWPRIWPEGFQGFLGIACQLVPSNHCQRKLCPLMGLLLGSLPLPEAAGERWSLCVAWPGTIVLIYIFCCIYLCIVLSGHKKFFVASPDHTHHGIGSRDSTLYS